MIIYKLTNKTTGKIYIGQTTRTLDERIAEHCRKTRTYIGKSIKLHGINNFNIEVIETCKSIEELNDRENYWIKYFNCITPNGYNMCEGGGNTVGFNHRPSSKCKMSVTKSKMYLGENDPFYGKHHSKEQIEKWKRDRKGYDTTKATEASIKARLKAVRNIDTGEVFNSVKEAAAHYGLKDTHISRVCKGKRQRTGGYRWEHIK